MNTKHLFMLHLRQNLPGTGPTLVSRNCIGREAVAAYPAPLHLAQSRRSMCVHTCVHVCAYMCTCAQALVGESAEKSESSSQPKHAA